MARRLHWRHKSPEAVLARAEEALHKTLYIVHQAGPTSFVLREETGETKFKVSKKFYRSESSCCCFRRVSGARTSARAACSGERESCASIFSGEVVTRFVNYSLL